MVQINHQPKGDGIPVQAIYNSKQNNDRRYSLAVKQPFSKQKRKFCCINGARKLISNSPTRQNGMSKPILERLLIKSFESTNSYYEFKDSNHDTIHSNSKKFKELNNEKSFCDFPTSKRTMRKCDLYSLDEDVEDNCELNKRIDNPNDCHYVFKELSCSKSNSFLSLKVKQNRSLSMKDNCDSDFDVKRDDLCQI